MITVMGLIPDRSVIQNMALFLARSQELDTRLKFRYSDCFLYPFMNCGLNIGLKVLCSDACCSLITVQRMEIFCEQIESAAENKCNEVILGDANLDVNNNMFIYLHNYHIVLFVRFKF